MRPGSVWGVVCKTVAQEVQFVNIIALTIFRRGSIFEDFSFSSAGRDSAGGFALDLAQRLFVKFIWNIECLELLCSMATCLTRKNSSI